MTNTRPEASVARGAAAEALGTALLLTAVKVIDLMEALKASVDAAKREQKPKRSQARKKASRRSAA
ncbi:MAG: hypothetical protein M3406_11845 [Chloroflexota bacterium]|nr:hypothetical protein [Chloroflexota bacterium]